eukprot:UN13497
MKINLVEMRELHGLEDQVELLGNIPHSLVRDVLVKGHIYLNCSLTESFCIAILEAAACGLYVVATNVGGVPEVLPPRMVTLADTDPDDLLKAIGTAISKVGQHDPLEYHT